MKVDLPFLMLIPRFVIPLLSLLILYRCIKSMLSESYDDEIWGYIVSSKETIPILHWENILGNSPNADIRLNYNRIRRTHAILTRSDKGVWKIQDVFSNGGVKINGEEVAKGGTLIKNGDEIRLASSVLTFKAISSDEHLKLEDERTTVGHRVIPEITLFALTVIQFFLTASLVTFCDKRYIYDIAGSFAAIMAIEWILFFFMKLAGRNGFEVETIGFYLCTLGLSVCASSTPQNLLKQICLIAVGVFVFVVFGFWLRNLKRTTLMRVPATLFAIFLFLVTILFAQTRNGAKNWIEISGISFQPSEFIKVCYIYFGASMLDKLYRKNDLFSFIVFSAGCVIALALIGDFGTALVFFVMFLLISFMRSGSIATVLLAVTGAVMAVFLVLTVKPYIARRFASWGHVWEDVYDSGYQQARAMSAAASGGLFGKGAGNGWLVGIFAADTDMVFAVIAEEMGLIVAFIAVLSVLVLAFFAIRSTAHSRSAYYSIAAVAAVTSMMAQTALNVFGSVDILPFTGVTFPFLSIGGTSLIASWMMLAFIKSCDTRRGGSFAVRNFRKTPEGDVPGQIDKKQIGKKTSEVVRLPSSDVKNDFSDMKECQITDNKSEMNEASVKSTENNDVAPKKAIKIKSAGKNNVKVRVSKQITDVPTVEEKSQTDKKIKVSKPISDRVDNNIDTNKEEAT